MPAFAPSFRPAPPRGFTAPSRTASYALIAAAVLFTAPAIAQEHGGNPPAGGAAPAAKPDTGKGAPEHADPGTKPPARADASAGGLSAADIAAGWRMLFDGKSTGGWRGYRQTAFPAKGWVVENGSLKCTGAGGGDLATSDEFGDFELEFEWKVAPKGNSGVIYRVSESLDASWQTGPEYQVLDDAGNSTKPDDNHSAGALYDLVAPAANKTVKPVGEFNSGRIRVFEGVVQHYLNGQKVLETRIDTPDWKQKIAGSKFKDYAGFGVQPRGHIVLQDHGGEIWYRNIRVRDLSAAMPGEKVLFDGKDLAGWKPVLDGDAKPQDVWSVADGVLICKGNPAGYIRTEDQYTNYVLKVEWRWNPQTKQTGNSGVLQRVQPPDKVWPKSVEAQLQHENAGDFWCIDEFPMKTDPARTKGRNTKKTHMAERPVGEWNEYEIVCDGPTIILKVNGEELNRATGVQEVAGWIALQSEGAEIHFRKIRLAPIGAAKPQ